MAQNVITPPLSSKAPKEIKTDKGTTYRIVSVFEKTIQLDELSMIADEGNNKQTAQDTMSIEIPLIKINDYILNRNEINDLTIDCTGFLPTIILKTIFPDQVFLSKEMPKDGDIISIAIRNNTDLLKIIRNDYVITSVHVQENYTEYLGPVAMVFFGELFIPGLKSQKNDFSFEGTSFEALQNFAKIYGLGFATNEDNTDDKQIWLKANMTGDIFVNNVVDRAWKDSISFYDCWIDLYYNLNFVNINKQLMSAENETDIAAMVSNIDKNWTFGADTRQENTVPMIKVFSNFRDFRNTSFFIKTWKPLNRSSAITFQVGTKMTCELFEHNQFVYTNQNLTKYWDVTINPTYDQTKVNKTILLRGRASYVKDQQNKDLQRANYAYVDLYEKFPWLGVQYTISNPDDDNLQWDGNHHKNYQVSKVQNLMNLKELEKLNLSISVQGNNFNVIRGDKMPLALIKVDPIENQQINPDAGLNNMLDLFYSGWYLVKGFSLNWNSENVNMASNFTHQFLLTRREWPAPLPVEPIKTTNDTGYYTRQLKK